MSGLSDEEIRRYSRQILLREVGGRGQARILGASATLICQGGVGEAGGAGEVAAQYLARAGVARVELYADKGLTPRLQSLLHSEGAALERRLFPLPLSAAPPSLRSLVDAAPAPVLVAGSWDGVLQEHLYWAIVEPAGVLVSHGSAALLAEQRAQVLASQAAFSCDAGSAVLAGSALSLGMLQGLLGMSLPPLMRF